MYILLKLFNIKLVLSIVCFRVYNNLRKSFRTKPGTIKFLTNVIQMEFFFPNKHKFFYRSTFISNRNL